jgi:nitroreductase
MSLLTSIEDRYSPRQFTSREITEDQLDLIFDAARRTASAFNEQPWTFVYAHKADTENFDKLSSVLKEGNAWAKEAAVLVLSFAKMNFDRNGRENRHALHDTGQAVAQMTLQAVNEGIHVHQMAGFDRESALNVVDAPEGYEAVTAIALGYPEKEEHETRQSLPLKRKSISEFAFRGKWNS